jgi:hypothetical protein
LELFLDIISPERLRSIIGITTPWATAVRFCLFWTRDKQPKSLVAAATVHVENKPILGAHYSCEDSPPELQWDIISLIQDPDVNPQNNGFVGFRKAADDLEGMGDWFYVLEGIRAEYVCVHAAF